MAYTVTDNVDSEDRASAHALWTLLTAVSGVGDELERARLTATGLPSVLQCCFSGLALVDENEATWTLVAQKDGHKLASARTKQICAELQPLFEATPHRPVLLISAVGNRTMPTRIPPCIKNLGIRSLALAPLRTLRYRLGFVFAGKESLAGFSREEELILSRLAEHSAIGVENLRLYKTLEDDSDDLRKLVDERTQKLERYTKRLETLRDIDRAVLAADSPQAISHAAMLHFRELVPCLRASVGLFDHEAGESIVQAINVRGETKMGLGASFPLQVFDLDKLGRGAVHMVADTGSKSDKFTNKDLKAEGLRSWISVPLIARDELIGALNVGSGEVNGFSSEHIEIAREVADSLAIAIQQAQLHDQLERQAGELEHRALEDRTLLKINNALVANLDRETLLSAISESLRAIVPFDRASLVLLDSTTGMVQLNAITEPVPESVLPVGSSFPLRGSHFEPVFRERRPMIRRHLDRVPLIGKEPQLLKLGIRSTVVVPLLTRGEPFGCLAIGSQEPDAYSDDDLDFLGEVALQVALATENTLAFEQIDQLRTELEQEATVLEQRVGERTAELEAFSYSVSHDLRAPLRAIDGFSRVLLEDYSDKLDPECNRLLNIICSNTRNMGQLIDDLLAFSRLGRQKMNLAEIDMGELARTVFDQLQAMTPERILDLTVGALPIAYADRSLIRQVFVNLLSNGIKFTTMRETAIIEVGYEIEDSDNIYYVKDNGVGFDMRYVEKIFGVFQRLHGADEFEGTGVGLAIVQSIIQRHGGRVWADAKINEGATIYFSLPRRESRKW